MHLLNKIFLKYTISILKVKKNCNINLFLQMTFKITFVRNILKCLIRCNFKVKSFKKIMAIQNFVMSVYKKQWKCWKKYLFSKNLTAPLGYKFNNTGFIKPGRFLLISQSHQNLLTMSSSFLLYSNFSNTLSATILTLCNWNFKFSPRVTVGLFWGGHPYS